MTSSSAISWSMGKIKLPGCGPCTMLFVSTVPSSRHNFTSAIMAAPPPPSFDAPYSLDAAATAYKRQTFCRPSSGNTPSSSLPPHRLHCRTIVHIRRSAKKTTAANTPTMNRPIRKAMAFSSITRPPRRRQRRSSLLLPMNQFLISSINDDICLRLRIDPLQRRRDRREPLLGFVEQPVDMVVCPMPVVPLLFGLGELFASVAKLALMLLANLEPFMPTPLQVISVLGNFGELALIAGNHVGLSHHYSIILILQPLHLAGQVLQLHLLRVADQGEVGELALQVTATTAVIHKFLVHPTKPLHLALQRSGLRFVQLNLGGRLGELAL